ncbi:MAG: AcrB/AcrD/AcrF family protein, partial [Leisingera sp.]
PMMFGVSLDFINGGYSIDSPTALWWKQLATAVVFGLGIATVLTLVLTPSLLAVRVWFSTYMHALGRALSRITRGRSSRIAQDSRLFRKARKLPSTEIQWVEDKGTGPAQSSPEEDEPEPPLPKGRLRAAE